MLFPIQGFSQESGQMEPHKQSIKRYSKHVIEIKENNVILKTLKNLLKPSNHYYLNINPVGYLHAIIQILQMESQQERCEKTRLVTNT